MMENIVLVSLETSEIKNKEENGWGCVWAKVLIVTVLMCSLDNFNTFDKLFENFQYFDGVKFLSVYSLVPDNEQLHWLKS